MKILIAGDWEYAMYETAFAGALEALGCQIVKFKWSGYFESILGKVEAKWMLPGPQTWALNRDLLSCIASAHPDVLLIWRGTHIWPSTLAKAKTIGVKTLTSYNHDDFTGPESGAPVPRHHHLLWRNFIACVPYYNFHFVKRQSNINHLISLNSKNNEIMPMWFVPDIHKPLELSKDDLIKYSCDIAFVGHYEPDGRLDYIRALVRAGLHVRLYGDRYWTKQVLKELYKYFGMVYPVYGEEYSKALCGAKICLSILSKLNRDTYTRRCYEIPACGKLLLCEKTSELEKMFVDGDEAVFFSSPDDLVSKAKWLIANPLVANRISGAGLKRVWANGGDVKSRAAKFLSVVR